MRRRFTAVAAVGLLVGALGAFPAQASPTQEEGGSPPAGDDTYEVYVGKVALAKLEALRESGIDPRDIVITDTSGDTADVEIVVSGSQAEELSDQGIELEPKVIDGQTATERATAAIAQGTNVFRPYGGDGGLKEEFEQIAADNRSIVKLVVLGQTVNGQDIIALKVTRNARRTEDGRRPATMFQGGQHAREWITPEMIRRLTHHVVDAYGTDPTITDLVNRTEMWFVPVLNPDGYDFTFEPGRRQWRKNLADNNGDGVIDAGHDGVDLNRNYPTKWGYDNEGSSPEPASDTYRGPAPASEPETRALDDLYDRIGFRFLVNYHSAAELLLWGTGWQVSTPTPDDAIYEAMSGTDTNSAIPGYDPDISAELYTTNGETTEHAHSEYGTLAFTPEMSTCETASESVPDDEWDPDDCGSVFEFPDDEELIQTEFETNIPFAIATAQSALDPDDPVSAVGLEAPDFVIDPFTESYGSPQTVAVTARRAQNNRRLNYSINGGPAQRVRVEEWEGGERYGGDSSVYYAEYRGDVRGAKPGDTVEVWFTANEPVRGAVESEHFTYTQTSDTGADALVIANEDYTGVNPTYPAGTTAPKYPDEYEAALAANDISSDVWDVDAQGVPHHLAVLGHYEAVVWENGDNRLTQEPEDELTDIFLFQNPLPDTAVFEQEQFLTMAVRDYLNEGGKLVQTGETAGYFGLLGGSLGGIYYGLDGAPEEDCVVTEDPFSDCLLLSDDFHQYYLGAFARATFSDPGGIAGIGTPLDGAAATFGGQAIVDNPLDEAGAFALTSDLLPPDEFPLFAGNASSTYLTADGVNPFGPAEGTQYAGAVHADGSYMRLARTVDLTGVTAADQPALDFLISFSTELGYDNVIVEAAPSGTDNWTTLPDAGGLTTSTAPTECEAGFLLQMHPFLLHYLTPGNPCGTTGTTGQWNRLTGESGGYQQVEYDLSAYAGGSVDLKISYVTDPAAGGIGVFVDNTRITTGGGTTVVDSDGFEGPTSLWTVEGAPAGSPGNQGDFQITTVLVEVAASVTTGDTVLLGYGIEQLATPAERADILGRIMEYLLA
jgi:hypothetical protein